MRRLPSLDSTQVGSLEDFDRTYTFVEARGDWLRVAPEHFDMIQRSYEGSAYNPAWAGWCALRVNGKTGLPLTRREIPKKMLVPRKISLESETRPVQCG